MSPERTQHKKRVSILAAAVVASGAAGKALLRAGLSSSAPLAFAPMDYIRGLASATVILGVAVLALNFIFQLSLLSWTDLTYALPVTSPTYALIAIIGVFGLHEHVSAAHWFGVLLILCGVIVVGRTKPLTTGRPER